MASEWIDCTLADACSSVDYGLTASASAQSVGPKFLRITDIVTGHIDWNAVPHVAADDATAEKYRLHDGDIVLARTGASTGASAYVKNPPPAVFASYLVRLQAKPEFDARFLAYYLRSHDFWTFIRGVLGDKSAQPNASASTMTKAPLRAPKDKAEQRAIAHILGTLDDKIELNRRMSETLEAMARALFKAWFVDFDPVRAKMQGRWQRGQSLPGLPAHLYDLFPDRLVDSELGEIPEGWRPSKLGAEVDTVLGGTPSRREPSYWGGDIPWINSGKANEFRVVEPSEFITREGLDSSAAKMLPSRTTIIAITGATLGQVSLTEIATCANQSIVGVLGTRDLPSEYIYFWIKEHVDDLLAWQTGGAQQHINKNNVNDLPVVCPGVPAIAAYMKGAAPAFDRIRSCCLESRTLAALRDALLPKLISGEVRVKDAERIIGRAG